MPRTSSAAKVQEWVDRLARFQGSGLAAAKFCQTEGVSLPSFYQWKRKLTAPACHDVEARQVRRKTPEKTQRTRANSSLPRRKEIRKWNPQRRRLIQPTRTQELTIALSSVNTS